MYETMIEAMGAVVSGLEYLSEATSGEAHRMADETLDVARSIRSMMEKSVATPQETAELIAGSVRKVFAAEVQDGENNRTE